MTPTRVLIGQTEYSPVSILAEIRQRYTLNPQVSLENKQRDMSARTYPKRNATDNKLTCFHCSAKKALRVCPECKN